MDPIEELLTRGVEAIYPSREFLEGELRSGKRLRVYMGIDPTAPFLHLGHVSQLQKLRRFQDLGHEVVLLIGDFTGMIGDPTDKKATRKKLTREQVLSNARSYKEQAGKILDMGSLVNPIVVRFNSEWLDSLTLREVVELGSEVTVQQMLERDMFDRRIKERKPVYVHELLYPLMQGYDSVAMEVDGEVGGSDQIFNMLVGTTLVKRYLGKQKFVLAGILLTDPEGNKAGKTEGKSVSLLDSPEVVFQKVMLFPDSMIIQVFELCTRIPLEVIETWNKFLSNGGDPLEAKKTLAHRIVLELFGSLLADKAKSFFDTPLTPDGEHDQVPEERIDTKGIGSMLLIDVLTKIGLAQSKTKARDLISQKGVYIDGQSVSRIDFRLTGRHLVRVGKKATSTRWVVLE